MREVLNYFNTSIWTIISFILVISLILIPLGSFLSYSFFTVEGTDIIHEFSLFNYREFLIGEIYINTFIRTIFLALTVMFICILCFTVFSNFNAMCIVMLVFILDACYFMCLFDCYVCYVYSYVFYIMCILL